MLCSWAFQIVKNLCRDESAQGLAGKLEGGGSPPRVGSNALNALHGKAFSERSEDFSAAQRRESIGIFVGQRDGQRSVRAEPRSNCR